MSKGLDNIVYGVYNMVMASKEAVIKSDRDTINKLKLVAGERSLSAFLRDIAKGESPVTIPEPIESRLANIEALLKTIHQEYKQLARDIMECPDAFDYHET